MPLPTTVQIMQPTFVSRPFHHEGWVYEEKVDAYRMMAYKDRRAVKRISRQGKDHTIRFPEIAAGVRRLENSASPPVFSSLGPADRSSVDTPPASG